MWLTEVSSVNAARLVTSFSFAAALASHAGLIWVFRNLSFLKPSIPDYHSVALVPGSVNVLCLLFLGEK